MLVNIVMTSAVLIVVFALAISLTPGESSDSVKGILAGGFLVSVISLAVSILFLIWS